MLIIVQVPIIIGNWCCFNYILNFDYQTQIHHCYHITTIVAIVHTLDSAVGPKHIGFNYILILSCSHPGYKFRIDSIIAIDIIVVQMDFIHQNIDLP